MRKTRRKNTSPEVNKKKALFKKYSITTVIVIFILIIGYFFINFIADRANERKGVIMTEHFRVMLHSIAQNNPGLGFDNSYCTAKNSDIDTTCRLVNFIFFDSIERTTWQADEIILYNPVAFEALNKIAKNDGEPLKKGFGQKVSLEIKNLRLNSNSLVKNLITPAIDSGYNPYVNNQQAYKEWIESGYKEFATTDVRINNIISVNDDDRILSSFDFKLLFPNSNASIVAVFDIPNFRVDGLVSEKLSQTYIDSFKIEYKHKDTDFFKNFMKKTKALSWNASFSEQEIDGEINTIKQGLQNYGTVYGVPADMQEVIMSKISDLYKGNTDVVTLFGQNTQHEDVTYMVGEVVNGFTNLKLGELLTKYNISIQ